MDIDIGSRIYLHNPPGDGNAGAWVPNTPEAIKRKAAEADAEQPQMNQLTCLVAFCIAVPLTAVTAEWVRLSPSLEVKMGQVEQNLHTPQLVDALEHLRENSTISQEWFGLIVLPVVSFSGEALVTILYFARKIVTRDVPPPSEVAKARTIDMSIQFTMFWMPFLVLIGWWTNRPLFMLFGE